MIIKEGMIGFSGGNGFIQRCIKFFTKSFFSHSFVTFKTGDILSVLETTSTLVCATPFSRKRLESNYVEMWELVSADETSEFIRQINLNYQLYSGNWYGYLSYIWFMYRWLARKFGVEPTTMWRWCDRGITCTELTVSPLVSLYHLFDNDLNTYAPEELRKIMLQHPDKFTCLGWYKE